MNSNTNTSVSAQYSYGYISIVQYDQEMKYCANKNQWQGGTHIHNCAICTYNICILMHSCTYIISYINDAKHVKYIT